MIKSQVNEKAGSRLTNKFKPSAIADKEPDGAHDHEEYGDAGDEEPGDEPPSPTVPDPVPEGHGAPEKDQRDGEAAPQEAAVQEVVGRDGRGEGRVKLGGVVGSWKSRTSDRRSETPFPYRYVYVPCSP